MRSMRETAEAAARIDWMSIPAPRAVGRPAEPALLSGPGPAPVLPRGDAPHGRLPSPQPAPARRARRAWLSAWGLSLALHAVGLGALAFFAIGEAPAEPALRLTRVAFHEPDRAEAPPPPDVPDLDLEPPEPLLAPVPRPVLPEPMEIEDVELLPDDSIEVKPRAEPFYEVPLRAIRTRVRPAPAAPPPPPALPPPPTPLPPPVAPRPPPRPAPAPVRRAPSRLRLVAAPRVTDYYPDAARRSGQQGTVVVLFLVDESGRVLSTTLERSSGYPLLDGAALQLVRDYRFAPPGTRRRGRLPVNFALQ